MRNKKNRKENIMSQQSDLIFKIFNKLYSVFFPPEMDFQT